MLGETRLTIQVLDGQNVIPAEDKILAELLVVRRHQGALDGGVLQPQRVADLMCHHDEQVSSFAAVQGPALSAVEMGFSAPGEEGVSQGTSWGHESRQGPWGSREHQSHHSEKRQAKAREKTWACLILKRQMRNELRFGGCYQGEEGFLKVISLIL